MPVVQKGEQGPHSMQLGLETHVLNVVLLQGQIFESAHVEMKATMGWVDTHNGRLHRAV
jgi:hypothetical protein